MSDDLKIIQFHFKCSLLTLLSYFEDHYSRVNQGSLVSFFPVRAGKDITRQKPIPKMGMHNFHYTEILFFPEQYSSLCCGKGQRQTMSTQRHK